MRPRDALAAQRGDPGPKIRPHGAAEAGSLAHDMSQRIQNEMTYPGQVKITVIRETRAVDFAR